MSVPETQRPIGVPIPGKLRAFSPQCPHNGPTANIAALDNTEPAELIQAVRVVAVYGSMDPITVPHQGSRCWYSPVEFRSRPLPSFGSTSRDSGTLAFAKFLQSVSAQIVLYVIRLAFSNWASDHFRSAPNCSVARSTSAR